jgi:hypothetical protein
MRIATILSVLCVAGALAGCGSSGVEFVASNPDSVLLDFPASPPGQLVTVNDTALQQCQLFNRHTAVLESLNVRDAGVIRATYLCRNTAEATPPPTSSQNMRRRQ